MLAIYFHVGSWKAMTFELCLCVKGQEAELFGKLVKKLDHKICYFSIFGEVVAPCSKFESSSQK